MTLHKLARATVTHRIGNETGWTVGDGNPCPYCHRTTHGWDHHECFRSHENLNVRYCEGDTAGDTQFTYFASDTFGYDSLCESCTETYP